MSTKRDRKRQERRRHHQRSRAEHRRAEQEEVAEHARRYVAGLAAIGESARDEDVAADTVVAQVQKILADDELGPMLASPVRCSIAARLLAEDMPAERAGRLARALVEAAVDDPSSGWVGAAMAFWSGNAALAEELMAGALSEPSERFGDPTFLVVAVKRAVGKLADVLELAERRCVTNPSDEGAQAIQAEALAEAWQRSLSVAPDADCACGSAAPWERCCRPREVAALARFSDRSPMLRLAAALDAFTMTSPELSKWLPLHVADWLDMARRTAGLGPADELGGNESVAMLMGTEEDGDRVVSPYELLGVEQAWRSGPDEDLAEDLSGPGQDDDAGTVLGRFAAASSTPADMAAAATAWLAHGHAGLWRLADPSTRPGVWLTDLVTRRSIYTAVPDDWHEGMPRWSVLLGWLVPLEGVWRPGRAVLLLDPATADAACALAHELSEHILSAIASDHGIKVGRAEKRRPRSDRADLPYGLMADVIEPEGPSASDMFRKVVSAGMAHLVGECEGRLRASPRLTNTDGDPLELFRVTVPSADPRKVASALAATPQFELEPDGEQLVWRGRLMTQLEAEQSLAEFRAQAKAKGWGEPEVDTDEPRYWLRGFVHVQDGKLVAELNSRARVEQFVEALGRIGVTDHVVERVLDPAQDLPVMRSGPILAAASSPEADACWRRAWLDDKVPALGGLTPRKAASTTKGKVALERLLRQFEHGADRARIDGKHPMDTEALRRELGMADALVAADEA